MFEPDSPGPPTHPTSPNPVHPPSPPTTHPGPGAPNVIPDSVELQGTIRALTQATFRRLISRVQEVVNATAAAAGATAAGWVWSDRPYPPVVNDDTLTALTEGVARRLAAAATAGSSSGAGSSGGEGGGAGPLPVWYEPLPEPTLAAEDFSLYTAEGGIPSSFVFMGIDGEGIGDTGKGNGTGPAPLHSPHFQLEERRLGLGAALHASLALRALWGEEGDGAAGAGGIGAGGGLRDEL
jgi:metal-dependent amidase/aminoacylase/carboxypeptidase family protein